MFLLILIFIPYLTYSLNLKIPQYNNLNPESH